MSLDDFCEQVETLVEREFGHADGGDLCYSLVEDGTIDMSNGVQEAARVVAQHIEQA